jgi:uncharacterized protein YjeT (DUF2065 family)
MKALAAALAAVSLLVVVSGLGGFILGAAWRDNIAGIPGR